MYCLDYVNEDSLLISSHSAEDASQLPQLVDYLRQSFPQLSDLILASTSLLCVCPADVDPSQLSLKVQQFVATSSSDNTTKTIDIPVCYATELAPDLKYVANHTGLSPAEVIALHQQGHYQVKTIGFMPGFAYLQGLSSRLALPRKANPASHVAAGSVAIAETMTAVYPSQSPGGWHIIGRSPLKLFNKHQQPMCPLTVGDKVRFVEIDYQQFLALQAQEQPHG
ncbi:5-oxoprolinase subunit PxpB [Agarivorans sp.]|uniref:5-oxoprolinase subunit PxpB n=1 Tax=Agarivorans sp. TaxID=1872412 RepID=UPI003D07D40F